MKTLFVDIDGTLVEHVSPVDESFGKTGLLPGVKEEMKRWTEECYFIIVTTGRKESLRKMTEEQLAKLNISYDHLIMGLPRGERIVINDKKKDGTITARALCINRNKGLWDCKL